MSKTKAQIINQFAFESTHHQSSLILYDYDSEQAMDSWAEQQSIEFAIWLSTKNYAPHLWIDGEFTKDGIGFTAAELYQLFLNDQNKASEIKKRSDNPILD